MLAAGLHPRVRSGASGSHYTSTGALPLIPGIDGVGETGSGELVYFLLFDTTRGSMAEQGRLTAAAAWFSLPTPTSPSSQRR